MTIQDISSVGKFSTEDKRDFLCEIIKKNLTKVNSSHVFSERPIVKLSWVMTESLP